MNYLVVIPARMKSSRLPGKPLLDLCGKSMIRRTYERTALAVPERQIVVATDHPEIEEHCKVNGINVIMTSPYCLTGTDRVAEVAEKIDADVYINVQGDEPVMNPEDVKAVVKAAIQHPGELINGYTPINEEAWKSVSVPKVVFRPDGRLLYMSRSPVPGNKKNSFEKAWRQVCVYAFPKRPLLAFAQQKEKTPLEQIEDLEILRFLEMGYEVRMIELSQESIAVDTPEDAEKVRKVLRV